MKAFYTLILVLMAGTAYGQSNLPSCQGGVGSTWSYCFGTYTVTQAPYKGDVYVGEFGALGVFHGKGTYFHLNGEKYVGQYKDGKRNGLGTYTYANGDKYVGEYKDGKSDGQGTYFYLNGEKYVGQYEDGKRNGLGTFTWSSGDIYVGEFKDDAKHGQGYTILANGKVGLGEYANNSPNGRFISYKADGSIESSGIFKDGTLLTSQYIDPNSFTRIARNNSAPVVSDSQRQEIEQRERQVAIEARQSKLPACQGSNDSRWTNCFGSWTYSSGDKHVGEYRDGKQNGQGTYIWAEGHKHVGEFKDSLRNGQGTFTSAKGDKYVGEFKDGSYNGQGTYTYANGEKYVGEWKDDKYNGQGILSTADGKRFEGIFEENRFIREAKVNLPSLNTNTADNTERNNLELERQRLAEERRRLEEDKRQRELAKQSSRISITASSTQPDSSGVVTINIQTNTDTSSLKINGEELGGKVDGSYSVKRVARVGQETKFVLAATDVYGNTDNKTITVVRQAVDSKAVFGQLNAANVKQQPARDAVAIIIGIERYKRVAKADYANADAQDFYDYANRALGIKPENIKLLLDEGADDVEIYKAFQNWLPVKVKKGKTDVYVFYSGHGYPGQDGNSLYFLPHGADKDLISKTAISQQEIVSAIQNAQPRTVTMFLDSCYSGQTRGGDVLIAGARPISPKISSNSYPPNFTVISASSNDQISSASPDLKHGIFSYFLMKGMEGDADLSKDGKITAAEMQEYLTDMVGRQAMGMNRKQQPQLFGDAERVLVGK